MKSANMGKYIECLVYESILIRESDKDVSLVLNVFMDTCIKNFVEVSEVSWGYKDIIVCKTLAPSNEQKLIQSLYDTKFPISTKELSIFVLDFFPTFPRKFLLI